jgi:hypothetical protein
MRIGDIIQKIAEIVDAVENPNDRNPGATPDPQLQNPAELVAVDIQQSPADNKSSPNGTTDSGNDKGPEELFLPPLQQKQELLKKAVGVENVYDDGSPGEGDENADAPTPEEEDILDQTHGWCSCSRNSRTQ